MEPKGTILIVDDEVGPRESLRMILKPHFAIFVAADGKEALSILRKEKIDVVTLDLKMPGLSGLDTLREIRRFFSDVEVVIITAYGSPKTSRRQIGMGPALLFASPSTPWNFLIILTIYLKNATTP